MISAHELLIQKRAVKPCLSFQLFIVEKDHSEESAKKVLDNALKLGLSELLFEAYRISFHSTSAYQVCLEYIDSAVGLEQKAKDGFYAFTIAYIIKNNTRERCQFLKVLSAFLGSEKYHSILEFSMQNPVYQDSLMYNLPDYHAASAEDVNYLNDIIKAQSSIKDKIKCLSGFGAIDMAQDVLGEPTLQLIKELDMYDYHLVIFSYFVLLFNGKIDNTDYSFSISSNIELCNYINHIELEDYFCILKDLAVFWAQLKFEFGLIFESNDSDRIAALNSGEIKFHKFLDLHYRHSSLRMHEGMDTLFTRFERQLDESDLNEINILYFEKDAILDYIRFMDKDGKRTELIQKLEDRFNDIKAQALEFADIPNHEERFDFLPESIPLVQEIDSKS
ncbi:hypothetical protein [Vibrio cholerae]|uniref:hypothetical protein n=1 Tax=Vibrio cholerae TaxID=666 RepID=UPI00307FF623